MNSELNSYKKNRIAEVTKIYVTTVNGITAKYRADMRTTSKSWSRNKTVYLKQLSDQYKINIAIAKNAYNLEVKRINAYVPPSSVGPITARKALLVGVNYVGTPYELYGCVEDAGRMRDLLSTRGFTEFTLVTDDTVITPTKENILNSFRNMIATANAGDLLFFYYSGHGSNIYDNNGDETDKLDEMIVGSDMRGVLDDEFKTILTENMKEGVTLFALFDSCYSGTMLDLKYCYMDSTNYNKYSENNRVSEYPGNVIMISGCSDKQTSSEAVINNLPQGAVSLAFTETLKSGGNLTWRNLLINMRNFLKNNGFTQTPQISTDSFYNIDTPLFV